MLRVCFALPLLTLLSAPASGADPRLGKVIQAVKQAERLYGNVETVVVRREELPVVDGARWLIAGREMRIESTRQPDRLRTAVTEKLLLGAAPRGLSVSRTRDGRPFMEGRWLSAFDGSVTRTWQKNNAMHVHGGLYELPFERPVHTWGMLGLHVTFPLSVYLHGTEAMAKHPRVHRYGRERGSIFEFYKVETEWRGEERVNGLDCVHLQVKRNYYTKDRPAEQELWLARDRNWLCAKTQAFYVRNGQRRLQSDSEVTRFEQHGALWFPAEVVAHGYRSDKAKPVVWQTLQLSLKSVDTSPVRQDEWFRRVPNEDGVPEFRLTSDLVLVGSPLHPQGRRPSKLTVDDVLERLKAEEQRYGKIDVTWESQYEHPEPPNSQIGGGFSPNLRMTERSRTVRTGDRFWKLLTRQSVAAERLNTSRDTRGSTGQWSWSHYQSGQDPPRSYLQINRQDEEAFESSPHFLIIDDNPRQRLSAHLLTSSSRQREITVVGDEIVNGLKCVRLSIETPYPNQPKGTFEEQIWLALDRNLLPVRHLFYERTWHKSLPTGVKVVRSFREIAPGLWYPETIDQYAFHKMHREGLGEGRLAVSWRRRISLKDAAARPKPEAKLFSRIRIPAGTSVTINAGRRRLKFQEPKSREIVIGDEYVDAANARIPNSDE